MQNQNANDNLDIPEVPAPPEPPRLERSARVLIGWMQSDDALRTLCGNRGDVEPSDDQRERVARARQVVAARGEGIDQTELLQARPAELAPHVDALRQTPASAELLNGGWDVALVDLGRVCTFQPSVFDEQAAERVADAAPGDVIAQAQVSLPTTWDSQIDASMSTVEKAIVASSRNLNLRVIGAHVGPPAPGAPPVFGFQVAITRGRWRRRSKGGEGRTVSWWPFRAPGEWARPP